MAKIDLEQIAHLADLAETLPAIKQEIADLEKSIGRLKALLGKKGTIKGRGKAKGKPGPKPKAKTAVKVTVAKKKPQKKTLGVKEKIIAAIANETLTATDLKKVDGRASAKFLMNMVTEGTLKVAGGKYSKA